MYSVSSLQMAAACTNKGLSSAPAKSQTLIKKPATVSKLSPVTVECSIHQRGQSFATRQLTRHAQSTSRYLEYMQNQ